MSDFLIQFAPVMNDWAAVFLLDAIVKATLLLVAAYLAAILLRGASAAVRHRIWCLTFVSLLLLPLLSVALPDWRLPILPYRVGMRTESITVVAPGNSQASTKLPRTYQPTTADYPAKNLPEQRTENTSVPSTWSMPGPSAGTDASAAIENQSAKSRDASIPFPHAASTPSWHTAIITVWLIGLGLALLPVTANLIQTFMLGRNARPLGTAEQNRLLQELCRKLGVRRPVRLLESGKRLVPVTWGVLRPIILLPCNWQEWSPQRQRIVLLHELAHIMRWDLGYQLLARLACAIYWFHPLAWDSLRRMRIERELACDDFVLTAGEHSSDYAEQLLQIAKECYVLPWSTAAVAMTHSSKLEDRIRALLNPANPHSPISCAAGRLIFVGSILLLTCVAFIGPAETAESREKATGISPEASLAKEEATPKPVAPPAVNSPEKPHASSQLAKKAAKDSTGSLQTADSRAKEDLTRFEFRGEVIDPEKKPVTGARIFFANGVRNAPLDFVAKPLAMTDKDGKFEFTTTDRGGTIVATAEGYGFAADTGLKYETTGNLMKTLPIQARSFWALRLANPKRVLQLVRDDTPVSARVLTADGKPIVGARARLNQVWINKNFWTGQEGDLTPFERAAKDKKADYYSLRRTTEFVLGGPQLPFIVSDATTGQDGRFTLRGVGRERVVELLLKGPNIETKMIHARTRKGEPIVVPDSWRDSDRRLMGKDTFYAADFDFAPGPSKPVVGRVTDADSGKPIAGVLVNAGQEGTFFRSGTPWIATMTDADGRYRLQGMPIGKRNSLNVFPPASTAYLPAGLTISTEGDESSLTHNFPLKQGIWLRGQVIDDRTKKPVAGRIQYNAFKDDPHLKSFPSFAQGDISHERPVGEDGRFEIPVLPGSGLVTFKAVDHSRYRRGLGAESITGPSKAIPTLMNKPTKMFDTVPESVFADDEHVLRQISPKEGAKQNEMTLMLTSGVDVIGYVLAPEGRRLSGVLANGNIQQAWYPIEGEEFRVEGYYPDRPRDLFFYNPPRDLAGYYRLEGPPPKELKITLQPAGSLSGRLLNDQGAPWPCIKLFGDGVPGEDYGNTSLRLETGIDGRFLVRGLVPGRKYAILGMSDRIWGVLRDLTVEAGKTKDIGDVKLNPNVAE